MFLCTLSKCTVLSNKYIHRQRDHWVAPSRLWPRSFQMHVRVKITTGYLRSRHLPGPHMPKCRLVYSRIKVWSPDQLPQYWLARSTEPHSCTRTSKTIGCKYTVLAGCNGVYCSLDKCFLCLRHLACGESANPRQSSCLSADMRRQQQDTTAAARLPLRL